jgi:hypothetical protein
MFEFIKELPSVFQKQKLFKIFKIPWKWIIFPIFYKNCGPINIHNFKMQEEWD